MVKLVGFLLLYPVVARHVKSFAVVWLEIWIGRYRSKSAEVMVEMIFRDDEGKTNVRMIVKPFRHENVGAEEYLASPKLRKQFALDLHMSYVLRVLRIRYRRNLLI